MTWLLGSILLVAVMLATASSAVNYDEQLERDDIIEAVNAAKTTWTAGRNFDPSLKKSYIKSLLGTKRIPPGSPSPKYTVPDKSSYKLDVPAKFDSRTEWSNCTGMSTIVDQGSCGSAWVRAYSGKPCSYCA